MESTTKPGFFITTCRGGLTATKGERVPLDLDGWGVEDFTTRLASMKDAPWWWSPHTWANDTRATAGWEAASCIALDLDYSAAWTRDAKGGARPDHVAPSPAIRDRLETALRTLPPALGKGVVLAHHTPRGARLVLLLNEPVTDRDLFVRAASGADRLVSGWLEAEGLLADTSPPSVIVEGTPLTRPGYEVDHKAATDFARVLWSPRATVPDKAKATAHQRDDVVMEYGHATDRFDARWLASLAPAPLSPPKPAADHRAHPLWPSLEAALLRSPGATKKAGKGVEVRCPIHGEDHTPSAMVFESGVLSCLASGCDANEGKPLDAWARTPAGAALLGDELARAVTLAPLAAGRVKGDTLRPFWRTVGEWGWTRAPAPPMRWLLTVPESRGYPETRHVLARGTVGMLAAGGGVGKSMALMQLAVAVASDTAWLMGDAEGAFPGFVTHGEGGKVLLALGEENAAKAHRRMDLLTAHLTPDERELLESRLVVLPLEAVPVGLMADRNARHGEEARAGDIADELERLLMEGGPWSLVILDPLSRFAGMETEIDNAAATRFVQVLERFTKAPGEPTVLVSHHTGQAARRDGMHDATAARGATALTDGVRWVATLTREVPKKDSGDDDETATPLLRMSVTKNNYGMELWPFWLARGEGGSLRCATRSEVESFSGKSAAPKGRITTKTTRSNGAEWGEP